MVVLIDAAGTAVAHADLCLGVVCTITRMAAAATAKHSGVRRIDRAVYQTPPAPGVR